MFSFINQPEIEMFCHQEEKPNIPTSPDLILACSFLVRENSLAVLNMHPTLINMLLLFVKWDSH